MICMGAVLSVESAPIFLVERQSDKRRKCVGNQFFDSIYGFS